MKQSRSIISSIAILALLNSEFARAVQVSAEAQQLEDESFLQLDAAFDEALVFEDNKPASSTLLQINKKDGARIQMKNQEESDSDSSSSDSDSDSEPEDH